MLSEALRSETSCVYSVNHTTEVPIAIGSHGFRLVYFYGLNPRHDTLFDVPRLRRGGGCLYSSGGEPVPDLLRDGKALRAGGGRLFTHAHINNLHQP